MGNPDANTPVQDADQAASEAPRSPIPPVEAGADLESPYWRVFNAVRSAFPATDAFLIDLLDPGTRVFRGVFYLDAVDGEIRQVAPPADGHREVEFLWGVANGEPELILRDAPKVDESDRGGLYGSGKPSLSLAYAPIQTPEGRVLGAMSAQSYSLNAYSQDDLKRLRRLAAEFAPLIEAAAEVDRLKRERDQLQSLNELMGDIAARSDPREIMEAALRAATSHLRAARGAVYAAVRGGKLAMQASLGMDEPARQRFATIDLAKRARPAKEYFSVREPLAERNGLLDDDEKRAGLQSRCHVPILRDNDSALGELVLSSKSLAGFPSDARAYLEPLAAQVGAALRARELMRRAAESERQTKATELRYAKLVETLADVVFTALPGDPPAFLTLSRGPIEEWTGLKRRDLLANPASWLERVAPEDRPYAAERGRLALSGKPYALQYRVVDANGEARLLQESATPVFDDRGRVVRLDGAFSEMTKGRRIERRIIDSQAAKSLRMLASGLSRELNGVFVGILSTASYAKRSLALDNPARKFLNVVESSAERARTLSEKLMAYSGAMPLALDAVFLNACVGRVAWAAHGGLAAGSLVEYDLDASLSPVLVDAAQVELALSNLLENAIEANEGRGRVGLATGVAESSVEGALPGVRDRAPANQRFAFIRVEDQGPGVSASEREKIFAPFVSSKSGGRGLGLSACAGVMAQHGGWIGVESAPGEGAAFTLYFPLAYDGARGPASDSSGSSGSRGRGGDDSESNESVWAPLESATILLVERDPVARESTALFLGANGYRVAHADGGLEAASVYRQRIDSIDLVALDLGEGGEAAVELAQTLKALRGANPFAKALALLPRGAEPPPLPYDDKNFAILRKPAVREDLLAAIRSLLG